MQTIPFDVLKKYLPKYLDPRDLSRLNATCQKFRVFKDFVDPNYTSKPTSNQACPFYQACFEGHQDLVGWMIDVLRIDVHGGLRSACLGGHQDFVKWLMNVKGATCVFNGIEGACFGGHQDLAEWLIDVKKADVNDALRSACSGGHQDLAEWLIDVKGATDVKGGLYMARFAVLEGRNSRGHQDLAKWLINVKRALT